MPVARVGPKALLSLCHEVDELSERIREFRVFGLRHLEQRRKLAIKRIRSALHGPQKDSFRARLRELRTTHALNETEVLALLFLFNRRVRRARPSTTGREILEALTRCGGDIIEASRFLHPDAPLARGGLIVTNAAAEEDVLDAEFRVSDRSFSILYRAFHALAPEALGAPRKAPYESAADHLRDLRLLCDLAKRRAGLLFPMSIWAEAVTEGDHDVEELAARYATLRTTILERERATPESVRLPLVLLRTQQSLTEDEEVIILTLLQHELYAARTMFELGELVRLVATSEEDLVLRRALVAPEGRLRQSGMLCVEEEPAGKDMFGMAWLGPGVTERLLGSLDPKGAIHADEKASFQRYLERLRGSDDFFRRL